MNTSIRATVLGLGLALVSGTALAQDDAAATGDTPSEGGAEPVEGGSDEPPAEKPAKAEGETASVSSADVMGSKKIRVGLRVGYGLPLGSAAEGSDMSDAISGQIPIWVDAGYMVTPNILVGAYFQYGFGFAGECPAAADCSATDVRFGLQGQYHLAGGEKKLDPWFGLGIGYEILSYSVSAGGAELSSSASGFEFLNLQGGADFPIISALTAGPFLSFSFGQFSSASIDGSDSASIQDKTMHMWLVLGAKGTFAL